MATNLVPYVPRTMPTLGSDKLYLQQELMSISQSIRTIVAEIAKIEAILTAHGLS